ncbi:related to carboxylesterase type B [Rhynchosporium secalis]|uniref:Carboxylic ester hydrolase n=1 Tax=Rhynchosporium secalis TaxID=38038 RepID=A0A1E1MTR9_RHYSE|nr:related to carboxylesterase type B [Rhynchosporium secalis]
MHLSPSILFLSILLHSPLASATQKCLQPKSAPVVKVLNGSYTGTRLESFKQEAFLGIPFAEPPVGDLRFANPKALERTRWKGVRSAGEYEKHCIGYGTDQVGYEQSEDCLYLNVIRPSGYENKSLPVAVWIHGGGFAQGGAPDRRYNLSFIVSNSVKINKPMVAVSIAYRLGPFGFLNGKEISDAGAINVGLKDQRLALHWVKENIGAFGGDSEKVTIWGESAGAASVGFHLTAFNGRDDKLFRAAIMESGGPVYYGELKQPREYQTQYDAVVSNVGCGNFTDSIKCLRGVGIEKLNSVLNSTELSQASWNPAIDRDFVATYGSEQLKEGKFVHVPVIVGANSDEGAGFSDAGIDTAEDLINSINETGAWPPPILDSLISAYVDSNTSDYLIPASSTLGGDITLPLPLGAFWRKSAAFSGDFNFIAARRLTCATWAAADLDTYCYRFNTIPNGTRFPFGSTHFSEVAFVFDNLNGEGYAVNPFGGKPEGYAKLATLMSKSWASFVSDLDPNSWHGREGLVEGEKEWPRYEVEGREAIVFEGNRTSYLECDNYREKGMRVLNENWAVINR